jgi:hypothetical protein
MRTTASLFTVFQVPVGSRARLGRESAASRVIVSDARRRIFVVTVEVVEESPM